MSGCVHSGKPTPDAPVDGPGWRELAARLLKAAEAELTGRGIPEESWHRQVYARAYALASELLGSRLQGGCCDEHEAAIYGASQYLLERAKWYATRTPATGGPQGSEER